MASYPTLHIHTPPAHRDTVIALVSQHDISGCQETDEGVTVYLPKGTSPAAIKVTLQPWTEKLALDIQETQTPYQNWNAQWESNFHPIRVGDFVGIRAEFHAPWTDVAHEIVIQPKMAFGTGHHATTWMMVDLLRDLPLSGQWVLDYGAGTGVLAIVAAKCGARRIEAVDIERESYENTLENAARNGVADAIRSYHGQLDDVPVGPYDTILANINRNVILASLPALYQRLRPAGHLLLSGILLADENQA